MIPTSGGIEAVDEGEGVGMTEFGGAEEHDGCFVERDGGAGVREGRVLGTQKSRRTGDI